MNEKFVNDSGSITIDDRGITCHLCYSGAIGIPSSREDIFYPYGSITELKLGFMGILTIRADKQVSTYIAVNNQKKILKQLLPTLQSLNANAPKCEPVILDMSTETEEKIEKTVESIFSFFGGFDNKHTEMWENSVSILVDSMETDEEIIHGFKGTVIYINGEQESVADYIGLITNKRFYYAGCEGKAVLTYLKTGTIELKDVHSITLGERTFDSNPYVKFEVNNDNYKLVTFNDIKLLKEKLEAGIKACKSTANAPIEVKVAVSAADELKKFKELLDMGIITQEEFDAKKKQLLNL